MKSVKSNKHKTRDVEAWAVLNGEVIELWFRWRGRGLKPWLEASIPMREWSQHPVDQLLCIERRMAAVDASGDLFHSAPEAVKAVQEVFCVAQEGATRIYDVDIETKDVRLVVIARSPEDAERAARRHVEAGAVPLRFTAWGGVRSPLRAAHHRAPRSRWVLFSAPKRP